MYSLVGCRDCDALWVVADRPETTSCPRCETRHPFDRLKRFAQHEEASVVREARTRLLAKRNDDAAALEELDHYEALEAALQEGRIEDSAHRSALGLDADSAAGADGVTDGADPDSPREAVLRAIRELESPTSEAIVTFARKHDVAPERARRILDRLQRTGTVTEEDGSFRAL